MKKCEYECLDHMKICHKQEEMKEWMMNDADIFDITENCFCKDPVCEKCDRKIGNKAQRKLLEHLIANPSMTNRYNEYVSKVILEQMLKQLEEKSR